MPAPLNNQVYVVDDTRTVGELISLMLRQMGCEPVLFDNAESCIAAINAKPHPLMVLVDLRLEGMRGDEACRLIRQDGRHHSVPLLVMTSAHAAEEVMSSWQAGADDFLPKPIRKEHLMSKLEALRAPRATASAPDTKACKAPLLVVGRGSELGAHLGSALESAGYPLVYAKTGDDALSLYATRPGLGAVLVDLFLTEGTGLAWVREARSRSPAKTLPFLLMTDTDASPSMEREALEVTGHALLETMKLPAELIVARVAALLPRTPHLRTSERVPFYAVVEYRRHDSDEWMSGFCYDISANGLFVRTLAPEPPRSPIELRLVISNTAWPSSGVVSWTNPFQARAVYSYPVGMGIALNHVDAEMKHSLHVLAKIEP